MPNANNDMKIGKAFDVEIEGLPGRIMYGMGYSAVQSKIIRQHGEIDLQDATIDGLVVIENPATRQKRYFRLRHDGMYYLVSITAEQAGVL